MTFCKKKRFIEYILQNITIKDGLELYGKGYRNPVLVDWKQAVAIDESEGIDAESGSNGVYIIKGVFADAHAQVEKNSVLRSGNLRFESALNR